MYLVNINITYLIIILYYRLVILIIKFLKKLVLEFNLCYDLSKNKFI